MDVAETVQTRRHVIQPGGQVLAAQLQVPARCIENACRWAVRDQNIDTGRDFSPFTS